MFLYALFAKADGPSILRDKADRLVRHRSRKRCAAANPDRHIVLFSSLSPKEKRWFEPIDDDSPPLTSVERSRKARARAKTDRDLINEEKLRSARDRAREIFEGKCRRRQ